jgi:MSHA type pilus biogenesis protein MshL
MGGGGSVGGSAISLSQENPVDFWKELKEQIERILTPAGRDSLAINMTGGLIQVTDRPSAVRKVGKFLETLGNSVRRQVDIEAKIYEVSLNSRFALGVDWSHVIDKYATIAADTVVPGGGPITAIRAAKALNEPLKNPDATLGFVFKNADTKVILEALDEQGDLNVISQPRLRTLNNQTALIKVGTDRPFFSKTTYFLPTSTGVGIPTTTTTTEDTYQTITVGTILAITPQISNDGTVTLDVSPVVTGLVETLTSPSGTTTAPVLDIKQASTLVRMGDGDTVVIGGLILNSTENKTKKVPIMGDIPYLGKLFQGKYDKKVKQELVIFITPRIVR